MKFIIAVVVVAFFAATKAAPYGLLGVIIGGGGGNGGSCGGGSELSSILSSIDVTGQNSGVISIVAGAVDKLTYSLPVIGGAVGGSVTCTSCGDGSIDEIGQIFDRLEAIVEDILDFTSIQDFQIEATISGLKNVVSLLTDAFGEQAIGNFTSILAQIQAQIEALFKAVTVGKIDVVEQITAQIITSFNVLIELVATVTAQTASNNAPDDFNAEISSFTCVFGVVSTALATAVIAAQGTINQAIDNTAQEALGELILILEVVLTQVTDVIAQITSSLTS